MDPEQPMVDDQQIRLLFGRKPDGGKSSVDSGGNSPDASSVLDLQSINRPRASLRFLDVQELVGMFDDLS